MTDKRITFSASLQAQEFNRELDRIEKRLKGVGRGGPGRHPPRPPATIEAQLGERRLRDVSAALAERTPKPATGRDGL